MTSVQDGGFYGWPYSYYGQHVDARVEPPRPDLVAKAIVPDYALGPHTASLGLAFATAARCPQRYRRAARSSASTAPGTASRASGYKVIFVPFAQRQAQRPAGRRADRLPRAPRATRYGRPVGVAVDGKGALLVADDVGNQIWRVTAASPGS